MVIDRSALEGTSVWTMLDIWLQRRQSGAQLQSKLQYIHMNQRTAVSCAERARSKNTGAGEKLVP